MHIEYFKFSISTIIEIIFSIIERKRHLFHLALGEETSLLSLYNSGKATSPLSNKFKERKHHLSPCINQERQHHLFPCIIQERQHHLFPINYFSLTSSKYCWQFRCRIEGRGGWGSWILDCYSILAPWPKHVAIGTFGTERDRSQLTWKISKVSCVQL